MPNSPSPASVSAHSAAAASWARFSPEFCVLLAGCQSNADRRAENLRECAMREAAGARVNWERVLELGEHHGVLPAVHQALCATGVSRVGEFVPEAVRDELNRRFDFNTRKNLRLAAELIHILDCLDADGVVAIPHKGPALAESVYGDLAMREFSDLDVLVRAQDVPRAKAALAQIRYRPNCQLSAAEERAYLATGYEYTFDGPAGKNLLEIQWNFVPRFFAVAFDMESIFGRTRSCTVAGRTVRTLAAEDLFVVLCVHAAKHIWGRLCWLGDIATVVERVPLDWERVREESRRLGVQRIVGVSLALARDLLGAGSKSSGESPSSSAAAIEALAAEVVQHIPQAEEYSTESMHYVRWMLRLRERPLDRLRFVSRLALTPSVGEWEWMKLPEPLFPLYRGVRLMRVGGRLLGLRGGSTSRMDAG